jgi:DNA-binding transcriptional MerR regulator
MEGLLSIGRFARRTNLTIKALRHYDEVGLLRPAVVNFATGFRYYTPEKVAVAERIRLLRSLEMSLADIRALLASPDPDTAATQLASHQQWLERRISDYQRALHVLMALGDQQERTSMDEETQRASDVYQCSFCGKSGREIERMIAGPNGVFICSECVEQCNAIIAEERAKPVAR